MLKKKNVKKKKEKSLSAKPHRVKDDIGVFGCATIVTTLSRSCCQRLLNERAHETRGGIKEIQD